jgi:hypothetical protein
MRPLLPVDFNEMLEADLVLLSKDDMRRDASGSLIKLYDGLEVDVFMEDVKENGESDHLVAQGVVEPNRSSGWGGNVKWCCRINQSGIRHQSELLTK